jgi:succinoglycan biosynthesis transport protein ExoP
MPGGPLRLVGEPQGVVSTALGIGTVLPTTSMPENPAPQPGSERERADFRDFLEPIWARKWLILALVAAVTAGTYLYYDAKPRIYSASTKIFVETSAIDRVLYGSVGLRDDRNVQNQATLLLTRGTAELVAKKIGFEGDVGALLGNVEATALEGSDFVQISATARSPEAAADQANGFAEAFIESRSSAARNKAREARELAERQLEAVPETAQTREQRDAFRTDIRRYRAIEGVPSGNARHSAACGPTSS